MEIKFQSLLISAILATTVRLFMYIFGGHESYLRTAIDQMGITVVILEICIVLLRFFSSLVHNEVFNSKGQVVRRVRIICLHNTGYNEHVCTNNTSTLATNTIQISEYRFDIPFT